MYIVKKDGLYLIGYQDMGVAEYVSGEYRKIPTGIYGERKTDAIKLDSKAFAELFGGEIISLRTGRTFK